jgi:DUF1009 family protein
MVGMKPLGLIAGEGVFPVLVARGARAAGRRVVCAGFRGSASPELMKECDAFQWVGVARIGQWVRVLRRGGCTEAIMVGRVAKQTMYNRWRYVHNVPDLRTLKLWLFELRHDKRPYSVLRAICGALERDGIRLVDSTQFTQDQMATEGVMTRRRPTPAQAADARFGWDLCQQLSRMDIGQAIAVVDKDVIAVEALEGTNAMIERAGSLCRRGGWTLIKVANSRRDMRVDVPTVGTTTIQKLSEARAGCLVLEAGQTIILEKQKVLEMADRMGIAVVGIRASGDDRAAGADVPELT